MQRIERNNFWYRINGLKPHILWTRRILSSRLWVWVLPWPNHSKLLILQRWLCLYFVLDRDSGTRNRLAVWLTSLPEQCRQCLPWAYLHNLVACPQKPCARNHCPQLLEAQWPGHLNVCVCCLFLLNLVNVEMAPRQMVAPVGCFLVIFTRTVTTQTLADYVLDYLRR